MLNRQERFRTQAGNSPQLLDFLNGVQAGRLCLLLKPHEASLQDGVEQGAVPNFPQERKDRIGPQESIRRNAVQGKAIVFTQVVQAATNELHAGDLE